MKLAVKSIALSCLVAVTGFSGNVAAQTLFELGVQVPPPAPPAPPVQHAAETRFERQSVSGNFYTVGDITDEEQLYLELINRARANPAAEGLLMANTTNRMVLLAYDIPSKGGYGVDINAMVQAFALIPPAPPLAPNAKLRTAARNHSLDMLDMNRQTHTGSNGSTIGTRILAEGYNWQTVAENVYAFSDSVEYGHFGFEVDWGFGPNGMQDPPGHRINIHNPSFKEIGVGIIYGSKPKTNDVSGVGPSLVSQEFGLAQNSPAFITGVVYYDFNRNNFYDVGEGLGNVQVSASGVQTVALTAPSGGYSLPVNSDGTYTVTFSGPGLPPATRTVTIQGKKNVKADLILASKVPLISGLTEPLINKSNLYSVEAVPGATTYAWTTFNRSPEITPEGAENTNNITFNVPANYVAISSSISKSGPKAFHLAHVNFTENTPLSTLVQSIEVNSVALAKSNARLRFQSRLGFATTNQTAYVQVSMDNGNSWTSVYQQSGSNGAGETGFNLRTVELGQYAGKLIKFRFLYDITFGASLYPGSDDGVGWYIDDIYFDNMELATNFQTQTTESPTLSLAPSATGALALQVTPKNLNRLLPPSDSFTFQPKLGPAEVRVTSVTRLSLNQVQVDFELVSGATPSTFTLQATSDLKTPFANDLGQTLSNIGNGRYQIVAALPRGGFVGNRFFRVVVNL